MNGEDHSVLVLSIRNDPASTARRACRQHVERHRLNATADERRDGTSHATADERRWTLIRRRPVGHCRYYLRSSAFICGCFDLLPTVVTILRCCVPSSAKDIEDVSAFIGGKNLPTRALRTADGVTRD